MRIASGIKTANDVGSFGYGCFFFPSPFSSVKSVREQQACRPVTKKAALLHGHCPLGQFWEGRGPNDRPLGQWSGDGAACAVEHQARFLGTWGLGAGVAVHEEAFFFLDRLLAVATSGARQETREGIMRREKEPDGKEGEKKGKEKRNTTHLVMRYHHDWTPELRRAC